MDPTLKKVLFGGVALLLSVLGVLLGYDRDGIKTSAEAGEKVSIENRAEIGLVKNDLDHVKADVEDLKSGQATIVEGQNKILETLYTLPSRRRQQERPVVELTPSTPPE